LARIFQKTPFWAGQSFQQLLYAMKGSFMQMLMTI